MTEPRPYVVVLTGGIASGKTAVSDRFAEMGVPVVDTDVIAHQVVRPGEPALEAIRHQFGEEFLTSDGALNRKKMREAIFGDPQAKKALEAILHPAIGQQAQEQVMGCRASWCLLVVPLLVESSNYGWGDRILVVDVEEEVQIKRVMSRDGVSREHALSILSAQSTRQQRLSIADDVIENNGTIDELDHQVASLYEKYTALAAGHSL